MEDPAAPLSYSAAASEVYKRRRRAGGVVADGGAERYRLVALHGLEPADAGAGIEGGNVEAGAVAVRPFEAVARDARIDEAGVDRLQACLLYTSPSPRD